MRPFDEVVAEHGAVVLRVCRAMLPAAEADDAWSETFLSAMRAYPDLRPDSNVRGWLTTIAHRKAIDQIRGRNRRPSPVDPLPIDGVPQGKGEPGADERALAALDRAGVVAELQGALDVLAPKQRGAVVYHYLAELPYAQVGELLGTSEAAARRSAADGIARLRMTMRGTPR